MKKINFKLSSIKTLQKKFRAKEAQRQATRTHAIIFNWIFALCCIITSVAISGSIVFPDVDERFYLFNYHLIKHKKGLLMTSFLIISGSFYSKLSDPFRSLTQFGIAGVNRLFDNINLPFLQRTKDQKKRAGKMSALSIKIFLMSPIIHNVFNQKPIDPHNITRTYFDSLLLLGIWLIILSQTKLRGTFNIEYINFHKECKNLLLYVVSWKFIQLIAYIESKDSNLFLDKNQKWNGILTCIQQITTNHTNNSTKSNNFSSKTSELNWEEEVNKCFTPEELTTTYSHNT